MDEVAVAQTDPVPRSALAPGWLAMAFGSLLLLGTVGCDQSATSAITGDSAVSANTAQSDAPVRTSPHSGQHASLGRAATEAEIRAWDIDVRPDFKGLPEGAGTVLEGEEIWLAQCASCHGDFGDSNEVFTPLVLGNITEADMEKGRVASLANGGAQRTTFMKVATLSTLWDYIHRAMPWNNPKSLSDDEVYAVLAYLLNLAYIVDSDFELSNDNIAEVQARMPNRNGMTREHGLWTVDGEPDTHNVACMNDCAKAVKVTSSLPDHAAGANGNLANQMRAYSPFPGVDTGEGEDAAEPVQVASAQTQDTATDSASAAPPTEALQSNGCMGCHQMEGKIVGPGFKAIADKYADHDDAVGYLTEKIRQGGSGVWGSIPMPPQPNLSDEDLKAIAEWLAGEG